MATIAFAIGRFLLAVILGLLPALAPILVGFLVDKLNNKFGRPQERRSNMVVQGIVSFIAVLVLTYLFGLVTAWADVVNPPYGGYLFISLVLASLTVSTGMGLLQTARLRNRIIHMNDPLPINDTEPTQQGVI